MNIFEKWIDRMIKRSAFKGQAKEFKKEKLEQEINRPTKTKKQFINNVKVSLEEYKNLPKDDNTTLSEIITKRQLEKENSER